MGCIKKIVRKIKKIAGINSKNKLEKNINKLSEEMIKVSTLAPKGAISFEEQMKTLRVFMKESKKEKQLKTCKKLAKKFKKGRKYKKQISRIKKLKKQLNIND